jgi:hypothetical protein
MNHLSHYVLSLAAVTLMAAVSMSAQNRATNTTGASRQTSSQSTTTKQDNTQKNVTTSSSRSGSQVTTTTRSTSSSSSSTQTKPASTSSSNSRSGGSISSDHRTTGSQPAKPANQPGSKPDSKPATPSKPNTGGSSKPIHIEQPSLGTHAPGKPDKPSGKYEGHYGGRPEPGHSYHEHKPKPAPVPSKPGHYNPKPYYHHGEHYYGHFITRPPQGLYSRRYNGVRYYYANGVFYQRVNNYYRICRPPYGYKIAWSKFGFTPEPVWYSPYATVIRTDIYYADGVFYRLSGRYFYVVEPPVGAIVPYLPADYHRVEMYGGTGFQVDNTIYQQVVLDGYLYYEVIANVQPRYY